MITVKLNEAGTWLCPGGGWISQQVYPVTEGGYLSHRSPGREKKHTCWWDALIDAHTAINWLNYLNEPETFCLRFAPCFDSLDSVPATGGMVSVSFKCNHLESRMHAYGIACMRLQPRQSPELQTNVMFVWWGVSWLLKGHCLFMACRDLHCIISLK